LLLAPLGARRQARSTRYPGAVRTAAVSPPLPLGEVLPSAASAESKRSLFGRFIGTAPSSDASPACMLIVRLSPA